MDDTDAINAIVDILNDAPEDEGWNADHFDAIAQVLDQVRAKVAVTTGPWAGGEDWTHEVTA